MSSDPLFEKLNPIFEGRHDRSGHRAGNALRFNRCGEFSVCLIENESIEETLVMIGHGVG